MSQIKLKDQPPHLRDRYGYRPTPPMVWVVTALVAITVASFATWIALSVANPDVTNKLLAWSAEPDHTNVTFEVRRGGSQDVECAVRIQNSLHHDVGYALVQIPGGTPYEQVTYAVATTEPGYAAEVLGCAVAGKLTVAQPNFPPGTTNPAQPWRP